jgi:hypothetical protein
LLGGGGDGAVVDIGWGIDDWGFRSLEGAAHPVTTQDILNVVWFGDSK